MSRDYTKISSRLYRSKKFRRLSADDKLAYIYLLISPEGNSAGCFEQTPHVAAGDLGCSEQEYLEAIERLSEGLIRYDEASDTVFMENWFKFNPITNTRHASGAVSQLDKTSCLEFKVQRLQEISTLVAANKGIWKDPSFNLLEAKIRKLFIAYTEPTTPRLGLDQTKPDQTNTNTPREIEISEDDADARDVTAAPAPSDGGEEDGGKRSAPSSNLKAAAEKLFARTPNVRVH